MARLGGQGLRGQGRREGGAAEPSGSVEFLQESLRAEKQDSQKRKLQEQSDAVLERQRLCLGSRRLSEKRRRPIGCTLSWRDACRRAIWRASPRPGQDS